MSKRTVALASDHGGFYLKEHIRQYLQAQGISVIDFGTHNDDSVDYPDMVKPACEAVLNGKCQCALLFCGTGIGISIAANKIRGIRAACCSDTFSAEFTRRHNDANALCLGGRVVGTGLAESMVDLFLKREFEGGRHMRRVEKISQLEEANA